MGYFGGLPPYIHWGGGVLPYPIKAHIPFVKTTLLSRLQINYFKLYQRQTFCNPRFVLDEEEEEGGRGRFLGSENFLGETKLWLLDPLSLERSAV